MKQYWPEILMCVKISGGLWLTYAVAQMVEELTRLQAWLDRIQEEQVEDGVTLCGRVE